MTNNTKYSLIIPVYNSEEILPSLFESLKSNLTSINEELEILFVEDGSTDGSWKKLKELQNHHTDITSTIIQLSNNFGQFAATLCGMHNAIGDVIITMDDDLQYDPADILRLIDHYEKNDWKIVYGLPPKMKRPFFLNWAAAYAKFYVVRVHFKDKTRPIDQSSFRVMNAKFIPQGPGG